MKIIAYSKQIMRLYSEPEKVNLKSGETENMTNTTNTKQAI